MVSLIAELIGRSLYGVGYRIERLGRRIERSGSSPTLSSEDTLRAARVSSAIKNRFGHFADCLEVFVCGSCVHLRGCVPEEWHSAIIEFARQIEPEAELVDELEYCTPVT